MNPHLTLTDRLLHRRLLADGDLRERARLLVWLVSGIFAAGAGVLAGGLSGSLSDLIGGLVVATTLTPLLLLRRGALGTATVALLSVIFVGILVLCLMTGGARSHALYLFALLPFLAAGLDPRPLVNAVTFGATATAIATLYAIDGAGVVLTPLIEAHARSVDLVSLTCATALVWLVTSWFVRVRRRRLAELSRAVEQVRAAEVESEGARDRVARAADAKTVVLERSGEAFLEPLNTILTLTPRVGAQLPASLAEEGRMLAQALGRLTARVEAFVAYSDATRRERPRQSPLDVGAIVERVAEEHRARAAEKGLSLSTIKRNLDAPRVGDAAALATILRALVDNAIKFTDAGEVVITASRSGAEAIRVTVSDTGPGVPDAIAERIFEPFFRADGATSTAHEGSGLGLSIARHFSRRAKGQLHLEPRAGDRPGARFTLTLPAPRAEP